VTKLLIFGPWSGNSVKSKAHRNGFKYASSIDTIHSFIHTKVLNTKVPMDSIPEWFIGARLNFAENLLKYRDEPDDHVAILDICKSYCVVPHAYE
jgi:hypothetical protein